MWSESSRELIIKKSDIHVWSAHLDLYTTRRSTKVLLSDAELEQAGRFRFDLDREYFVASRSILRFLAGRYLGKDPANIEFELGKFGKPRIPGGHGLEFNISHSGGRALFGFTKNLPIGIDLEYTGREVEIFEVARRYFSQSEVKQLSDLPRQQWRTGFFNCWTRKEAFIKAVGSGLYFPLDKFEVSLSPADDAELRGTFWDPSEVNHWAVYSIIPAIDFIGALAVRERKENLNLRLFDFAVEED